MSRKQGRLRIYFPTLILFTIVTLVLRTIALFNDYDSYSGYFTDKTLINVANYILIGICVLFLGYFFFGEKSGKLRYSFGAGLPSFASAILALGLAFLLFFICLKMSERGISPVSPAALAEPLVIFEALIFVFAILAIIYLALTVIKRERHSEPRAAFGLCTVIFFALYATYLYFETTLPINAPNKIVDQMAYLFAALFFLFETRISLGRELWRAYTVFGLISAILSAYASIPALILYFSRDLLISNSLYDCFLTLTVSIYVTVRLFSYSKLKEDKECEFVSALRAGADETEERLHDAEEREKLEYIELINRIAKREEKAREEEKQFLELSYAEEADTSAEHKNEEAALDIGSENGAEDNEATQRSDVQTEMNGESAAENENTVDTDGDTVIQSIKEPTSDDSTP